MCEKIHNLNLDDETYTPDDMRKLRQAFIALAIYCEISAQARTARIEGNIPHALEFEKTNDDLYKKLPAEAKW